MPYASDLIKRKVRDTSGKTIGRLEDIAVDPSTDFPPITGILVKTHEGPRFVPQARIHELSRLGVQVTEVDGAVEPPSGSLLVRRELLDRQIIDAAGARVVRVNDIYFAVVDGISRLSAVDSSFRGFLRRLGLSGRRSPQFAREVNLLPWADVEFIPGSGTACACAHPRDGCRGSSPRRSPPSCGKWTREAAPGHWSNSTTRSSPTPWSRSRKRTRPTSWSR
jgi:sporulation protein YlmC with PRC-barrel domain